MIAIRQLTKRYGRRVGIDKLDLSVSDGTLFGFLGPNGSGKTTTIRLLLGLLRPNAGGAEVFGLDCWKHSHRIKSDVGYLPGDLRLYPWLTGRSALKLVGQVRGRDLLGPGDELAEEFELDLDVSARNMSRGMRQKLGLILALAHRPKLLILDEPTASLDPLMQKKLLRRLRGLARDGHTIFFSSHTLSEVEQLCDRVAILRKGKLVADESLDALRARAKRVVTLTWRTIADAQERTTPSILAVFGRQGRCWKAEVTGSPTELLRWAAMQPIEDFSFSEPDLTRLFEQYYE